MKLAFIDSPSLTPWSDCPHRLAGLAASCHAVGHHTILIDASVRTGLPVLSAFGRERDTRPLAESVRLVAAIKALQLDVCVLPARGGLAHGLLMARACGEIPAALVILIVEEESTRSIALRRDLWPARMQTLVADAMERFCADHADAIATHDRMIASCHDLPCGTSTAFIECLDAPLQRDIIVRSGECPTELVFCAPFERASGLIPFIDALDDLPADPSIFERVTFLGPMVEGHHLPNKEWLGRRAARWPFQMKLIETRSLKDCLEYVKGDSRLSLIPEFAAVAMKGLGGRSVIVSPKPFHACDPKELGALLLDARAERPAASPDIASDLSRAARLADIPRRVSARDAELVADLSICILHHERPKLLREAVASVLRQINVENSARVEVVVFDNGSTDAESGAVLDELAANPCLSVVRQVSALQHPIAMNAMAAHATRSYLVFLDDDNLLADHGLEALLKASSGGAFDVVTSNLHIFDSSDPIPKALMAFIGPASTAGLFFNGFGDTCMAFGRRCFLEMKGFLETGGSYSAPDWILLARAQAAGLRIGVLQQPAFLYRRDIARSDLAWRKYDQNGLRTLLLQNFGRCYDELLVAKLSQLLLINGD